jgi:hypothetical protein
MDMTNYKVELANKISGGRAIGNLWGVARYIDGRRGGYVLQPQDSEQRARDLAADLNGGCS